jgi:hypothetical protein
MALGGLAVRNVSTNWRSIGAIVSDGERRRRIARRGDGGFQSMRTLRDPPSVAAIPSRSRILTQRRKLRAPS